MEEKKQEELQFVAQQLRKPSGEAATMIGEKMNEANAPMFDLSMDVMQPQDGERILEIGFGTGEFFDRLFSRNERIEVHGVDYSPEMVSLAEENNPKWIDSGKLKLEQCNSDDLDYPDNMFDKVFCNMVVFFWDDPEPHLKEVHRVLKPGGKFYTGIRSKESMRQLPFVNYGFMLYDPEEWIALLKENGFRHVDTIERKDPVFDDGDREVQLDSICIVAENTAIEG